MILLVNQAVHLILHKKKEAMHLVGPMEGWTGLAFSVCCLMGGFRIYNCSDINDLYLHI